VKERGNRLLRLADYYLGIPAVASLALAKRGNKLPSEIRTIGILNTAAIGDTILTSAIALDIKEVYPEARLVYFSGNSNYQAACMIGSVDYVVGLRITNLIAAVRRIRRHKIDLFLDFGPWARINALLSLLSGARFTVGFRSKGQCRHFGYDIAVQHSAKVHEIENYRRILRVLGITVSHMPALTFRRSGSSKQEKDRPIVFHLWAGGIRSETKEWPIERWIKLAEYLAREGYRIIFTGSRSQLAANDQAIAKISRSIQHAASNAAGASLEESADLVAHARLVVSVNTGIMHIAAAVGTPLVALHGPTNAKRWGPVSTTAIVIESPAKRCGYLHFGFEYLRGHCACMKSISLQSVLDACHRAL
jgi:lipopolysaccharide heptosyltransferase III